MDTAQRMTLRAFLALPYQSAAGRLKNIRYNRFYEKFRAADTGHVSNDAAGRKAAAAGKMSRLRSVQKLRSENSRAGAESMSVRLSCVILNYNDAETTEKLVKQIADYNVLHQIIVVDNASTDDSLERLKKA